jgi:hypothetical protein
MGQQIAFIILIALSGMILFQVMMIKNEIRKKFEQINFEMNELQKKVH